jgi:hypothetical protein
LVDEGKMKRGQRLTDEGKMIARKNVITDGPFGESKEVIGGYWFILANNLDEAVQIAKGNPRQYPPVMTTTNVWRLFLWPRAAKGLRSPPGR